MSRLLLFALCARALSAREITFPPIDPLAQQQQQQQQQNPLAAKGEHDTPVDHPIDVSGMQYGGLMTYANLPYVHCLAAEDEEVDGYDIAVVGAPFDTVSPFSFLEVNSMPEGAWHATWSLIC